jgi:hypothetical protein
MLLTSEIAMMFLHEHLKPQHPCLGVGYYFKTQDRDSRALFISHIVIL